MLYYTKVPIDFQPPGLLLRQYFHLNCGGETGIRTLETVTRLHAFQACAFDHSATSPQFRRFVWNRFICAEPARIYTYTAAAFNCLFGTLAYQTKQFTGVGHTEQTGETRRLVVQVSGAAWLELRSALPHVDSTIGLGFAACVPLLVSRHRDGFSRARSCCCGAGFDTKYCGFDDYYVLIRLNVGIYFAANHGCQSECC